MFASNTIVAFSLMASVALATDLPTVDLGYEVHRALAFNDTSKLYSFSNIRYAQAPVGDLRWALPVAPTGVNPDVQDGAVNRICPQGFPKWFTTTAQFNNAFARGNAEDFNYTSAETNTNIAYPNGTGEEYSTMPGTTDDCLFLDVRVPESVFTAATAKAPVLVWIHGGAYVQGNKVDGSAGDPSGLIAASQASGRDGFVYVSINYRLGGLGFMAGPVYESQGGIPNLGLHDQRLALDWVQKNIHRFGGDPKQVTVAGGSAGAGSILYHLISGNVQSPLPFQRAWIQSPGLVPASEESQDRGFQEFSNILEASGLRQMKSLSPEKIIRANADVISGAPTSTFRFAPVDDGAYVPSLAFDALKDKQVHRNVTLLISYTKNEGTVFVPSYASTDCAFKTFLKSTFRSLSTSDISHIVNDLYPLSDFENKWSERIVAFIGDYGLKCYASALSRAYGNETHNYEWQIFPAFHGSDFLHAFYNGDTNGGLVHAGDAALIQNYISNFVVKGDPNGPSLVEWPVEGENADMLGFTLTGPVLQRDPAQSERCAWIQDTLILS